MVDQVREWLGMIPPEERKRWSWLLDQNTTAFGNPRMVDTPVGRVYNPTSYPSDLIGALGTAVRDPIKENVLEPAVGEFLASMRDAGLQQRSSYFFPNDPGGPTDTTEQRREYLRKSMEGSPVGEFAVGMVTSPESYLGGPIARVAHGVAALPGLSRVPGVARGLGAVAGADELYSEAMGQVVGAGIKGATGGLKLIPGVRPWLEASPQKAIAQFSGRLARAVDDPQAQARVEKLVDGSDMGLTGTHVDWEGTIRPEFARLTTEMSAVEHPLAQALLVQQRAKALAVQNVLEARAQQHLMALEEGRLAGEISEREFFRERRDIFQLQARATRALQLGLFDSIDAVKKLGAARLGERVAAEGEDAASLPSLFDVFGRVGDDAVQAETLRTALQGGDDAALAAHDMGTALTGGQSGGEFSEKVPGLFNMSMGAQGERIAGLQAQDPFYRTARAAAGQAMDEAAQAVIDRYKDVVDPSEVATLDDTIRSAFQAAERELAPFTQTPEQALAGLGPSKRDAILSVWDTDSKVSLPRQLQRVLAARRNLTRQVTPVLHDWYREMGYSLEQRTAAVDAALTSADRLLNEPALLAPESAALRAEVMARLNTFNGDILAPGNGLKMAANQTVSAFAKSLGVKAPHPLLGAAVTQLGAWKEQAVLSPAFQLANLIGGLVLSEAGNVSGIRVLNLLRHTLPQMKPVILEGKPIDLVFDAASSRTVSALYGDAAGRIRLPEQVLGRQGGAIDMVGGLASGPASTNSGKIPFALRAGIPALATGGGYWAQNADDPDRARNALLVGAAAGTFGAMTPRFVFYNQNLSAASEGAMRAGAYFTGIEEDIGRVSTGGRAKLMHDQLIDAALKPTVETSVGKELTRSDMLPGLNTITGMQGLSDFLPQPKALVDLPPLGAGSALDEASAARTAWTGPLPEGPAPVWPAIPHSDRLQPAVVSEALAMLPEAIRADVVRRVARIGVRDFGGDGGKFVLGNPGRPGTVFVEPDQVENARTIAHELLHAHTAEANFSQEFLGKWAEARYRPELVPEMKARIARGEGVHAFGMAGDEDLTVAIERALFDRDAAPGAAGTVATYSRGTLPKAQQDVIDAYLASLEAPPPIVPPPLEAPPLPSVDIPPPDARASRVVGLHRTGPSPTATAGTGVDVDAVKRAFAEVDGLMSADALEQVALRHGATAEQAATLRAAWDEQASLAHAAGVRRSNAIHFDYSDVNRLTAAARDTGVAPFITWQQKALPKFASLLLQNPRFLVAIDGLNNLTDADAEEAGLTSRYARLVKLGGLGDFLAEQVLGRADGTMLGAPLKALFPYSDVGKEDALPANANPLERVLAELRPLGLSPGPVVGLPLMAVGATSELPVDLYRTSPYLKALSTQLTGREADPELLTKHLIRAARGAVGAGVQPTVTGDFLRDRAIRQRIAEIAVEETGKPPAGPYAIAMDDPASQLWLRARAEVDRQRMGEVGLSATLPFRTKLLSDTEAQIRGIREQTGVGPADSAARRAQPATPTELATAQAETLRKPLKAGETLADRVGTARWIAAENTAASVDPRARALNNLGGDQALGRQFPDWLAFQRRTKHMSPKRRGQLTAEFLGQRPALAAYLSSHNIY